MLATWLFPISRAPEDEQSAMMVGHNDLSGTCVHGMAHLRILPGPSYQSPRSTTFRTASPSKASRLFPFEKFRPFAPNTGAPAACKASHKMEVSLKVYPMIDCAFSSITARPAAAIVYLDQ